jgi:hypothetical protein
MPIIACSIALYTFWRICNRGELHVDYDSSPDSDGDEFCGKTRNEQMRRHLGLFMRLVTVKKRKALKANAAEHYHFPVLKTGSSKQ